MTAMTQQFKSAGVPLFKASGVPAMDPDCCCGDVLCDACTTGYGPADYLIALTGFPSCVNANAPNGNWIIPFDHSLSGECIWSLDTGIGSDVVHIAVFLEYAPTGIAPPAFATAGVPDAPNDETYFIFVSVAYGSNGNAGFYRWYSLLDCLALEADALTLINGWCWFTPIDAATCEISTA